MIRTAFFTPSAKQDLAATLDWYENEREGLGYEFVAEVQIATNRVERNHEIFAVVHRDARICAIKRFPYIIIFRFANDRPEILAVVHGGRDPNSWKRRV